MTASITEGVMSLGSFTLPLDLASPRSIVENIPEFSTVCITPGRCDGLGRDEVLATALYSGMVRRFSTDRCTLRGPSIMAWIGDEDGKNTAFNDSVTGSVSAVAMINDLFASTSDRGGLTLGSTTGLPTTPVWAAIEQQPPETRRQFLDRVCRVFGWQYRVSAAGVIDVKPRGDLFRSTPAVIVMADHLGEPVSNVGLLAVAGRFDAEENWDDWAAQVWTYDGTYAGLAMRPFPYADDFSSTVGSAAPTLKWITGSDYGSLATADLEAANLLDVYDVRQDVNIEVDLDEARSRIEPGDTIWAYDPLQGLYDVDNQVLVMGQCLFPVALEVTEMTWKPTEGMGAYVILNGTDTVWNLSEYVLWGSGSTSLKVGAKPQFLREQILGKN